MQAAKKSLGVRRSGGDWPTLVLWFCLTAFLLLFLALMSMRARLERQRVRIEHLYLAEDEA